MINDFFQDLLNNHILTRENVEKTDDQFIEDLNCLSTVIPNSPLKYEIDFKRAFYPIRKYYHKRITNETYSIYNQLFDDFTNDKLGEEFPKKYKIYHKFLSELLRSINKYLYNKGIKASFYLNPKYSANADQAYIIFFLKANMIMLLMELQDNFGKYSTTDILSTEEIYEYYFNENLHENSPIIPLTSISKTQSDNDNEEDFIKFKPILGDMESRSKVKKIISFKKLIKKSDKFLSLEVKLFNNSIIDEKYNFIADKGNKQLLAAFIHQLIRHDYLHSRLFPGNITIKERDITKFFAIRYGSFSDCDKEFRNFKNKDRHKLQKLIDYNLWLDSII